MLERVRAVDRYTVEFTLKEPFGSFPINLVIPIVPNDAGAGLRSAPIGTGPYRFVSFAVDDRVVLAPFEGYMDGAPQQRRRRDQGRARRHDARPRAAEGRRGSRRQRPGARHRAPAARAIRRCRSSRRRAPTTRTSASTCAIRSCRTCVCGRPWPTPSTATPSSRTCGAGWRGRPSASCRRCRGRSPPTSPTIRIDPCSAPGALLDEAGYRDPDGDGPAAAAVA